MTDDPLAFTEKTEETTQPVAPAAAPAADPVAKPVETSPPAAAPTDQGHNVPLPKYLDTYNELRDAKRRLQQLEEEQKSKAETPDALLDPEGFAAHQQQIFEERMWDQRCNLSEVAAKRFYGKEVVDAAFQALQAQSDPMVGMRIRQAADPWDYIVNWHKREKLLQDIGEDPDAYKARIIAEAAAAAAGQSEATNGGPARAPDGKFIAASTQQARTVPAASLSRAPSGGKASDVPVGPGQAFDTVFAGR